jgi:hypothetical protein
MDIWKPVIPGNACHRQQFMICLGSRTPFIFDKDKDIFCYKKNKTKQNQKSNKSIQTHILSMIFQRLQKQLSPDCESQIKNLLAGVATRL